MGSHPPESAWQSISILRHSPIVAIFFSCACEYTGCGGAGSENGRSIPRGGSSPTIQTGLSVMTTAVHTRIKAPTARAPKNCTCRPRPDLRQNPTKGSPPCCTHDMAPVSPGSGRADLLVSPPSRPLSPLPSQGQRSPYGSRPLAKESLKKTIQRFVRLVPVNPGLTVGFGRRIWRAASMPAARPSAQAGNHPTYYPYPPQYAAAGAYGVSAPAPCMLPLAVCRLQLAARRAHALR